MLEEIIIMNYLGYGAQVPTQLIISLGIWTEILRIGHPVNYSYLPL